MMILNFTLYFIYVWLLFSVITLTFLSVNRVNL